MDWANNLFLVLLLTDITGTIFFLAERFLQKKIKPDVGFQRFLTVTSMLAYLVPLVYFILYADRWFGMAGTGDRVNLFYNTPLIKVLNVICGCVWVGLFLIFFVQWLTRHLRWKWICRGNIPEEDETVFKVFREVCAELGIRRKMSVCMNDSVDMPCITYDHGYTVVMPLWQYTEEEARIIFYHELCHFRNGDLFLKTIGSIAALLHAFNPIVHKLYKQMKVDCEKYCDRVACKKGKYMFTGSGYFQVILNLSSEDGGRDRFHLFTLADDRSDCERRIECMSEYETYGGMKRRTAILLGACFLLGSSTTSLAAGTGVLAAYEELAEWTSVRHTYTAEAAEEKIVCVRDENAAADEMVYSQIEDTVDGLMVDAADDAAADEEVVQILSRAYDVDPEDVIMMEDDGIEPYGLFTTVSWKVPAGKLYVSSGFRQTIGDWVSLTVAGTPADIEYEMGIKDPDEIMWYVLGSDTTAQKFDIVMNGRHYFYVMNTCEDRELQADICLIRHIGSVEEKEEE